MEMNTAPEEGRWDSIEVRVFRSSVVAALLLLICGAASGYGCSLLEVGWLFFASASLEYVFLESEVAWRERSVGIYI
jgi:hypothetical protein